MERLLDDALKVGIPVLAFWDMTFRETLQSIEAAVWRLEQEQKGRAWLAWHVAALQRAKTMPALGRLVKAPAARRLQGDDLEKRREEFERMSTKFGSERLRGSHGR